MDDVLAVRVGTLCQQVQLMAEQMKSDHDLLVEMHTMMTVQTQTFRDHVQTFKEHVLEDDRRAIEAAKTQEKNALGFADLKQTVGNVSINVGLITGGCAVGLTWLGQWVMKLITK